jgi:DNA mismatch repair ATPase MutS
MKAFLMHRNRDLDLRRELPWNEQILKQDLELNTLFNAMALGDAFLYEVAEKTVLTGLYNDPDTILYRQDILKDCLKNSSIVRDLYNLSIEGIESKKKTYWGIFSFNSPATILHSSIELMQLFVSVLKKLRNFADEHAAQFESEGFTNLFAMLKKELGDEYFTEVENHLMALKFRDGVMISAELGQGNKGTNYLLCKPHENNHGWLKRLFAKKTPGYTFHIHERDESGSRILSGLRDRGTNLVANALAQSADHVLNFFIMLRTELAFYVGCLNLHEQLEKINEPVSFPLPAASGERTHSFKGLYDVCLALSLGRRRTVGNDVNADNKNLVIITGANQGGKSTFLRSIGLAQLMMQGGMFVPAESFSANVCGGVFTHYKRKEDAAMNSGKLDEELGRMSEIVDHMTPDSLLLFNESFAATNEREGSEISRQIISALVEKHIKVFFVTHVYTFAHDFYDKKMKESIFLRAERQADGKRSFKLIEGEPLQTSFGEDLYKRIFITEN